jgi:hypothetical protein
LERKNSLQCSPWGRWPARAGKIPAMSRRSSAGEGRGVIYGSLALGFGGWTGTRRLGRWGAPAANGTGRRGWPSRRGGPRSVAIVGRRAVVELEECAGDLGWRWELQGGGLAAVLALDTGGLHGWQRMDRCAGVSGCSAYMDGREVRRGSTHSPREPPGQLSRRDGACLGRNERRYGNARRHGASRVLGMRAA